MYPDVICRFSVKVGAALTAGLIKVQEYNAAYDGPLQYQNGVVFRDTCANPKSASLVFDIGWPCRYGGAMPVLARIGGAGNFVQSLVFYLPIEAFGQPHQGPVSRPREDMEKDIRAVKESCWRIGLPKNQAFKKVDTTVLARCIFDSFPRSTSGRRSARKLRGLAVFPASPTAEGAGYGLAAVTGHLFSDTIDLFQVSRDLNLHPLYLHIVAAFPA